MSDHKVEAPLANQTPNRLNSAAAPAAGALKQGSRPQTAAPPSATAQQKLELLGGNRAPVARLLANQGPADERDFRSEYQGAFYPEEERYVHNPAKKAPLTVPPQYANQGTNQPQQYLARAANDTLALSKAGKVGGSL